MTTIEEINERLFGNVIFMHCGGSQTYEIPPSRKTDEMIRNMLLDQAVRNTMDHSGIFVFMRESIKAEMKKFGHPMSPYFANHVRAEYARLSGEQNA